MERLHHKDSKRRPLQHKSIIDSTGCPVKLDLRHHPIPAPCAGNAAAATRRVPCPAPVATAVFPSRRAIQRSPKSWRPPNQARFTQPKRKPLDELLHRDGQSKTPVRLWFQRNNLDHGVEIHRSIDMREELRAALEILVPDLRCHELRVDAQ